MNVGDIKQSTEFIIQGYYFSYHWANTDTWLLHLLPPNINNKMSPMRFSMLRNQTTAPKRLKDLSSTQSEKKPDIPGSNILVFGLFETLSNIFRSVG